MNPSRSETTIDVDSLEPLFAPRSVAVIGASSNPDRIGGFPVRFMREQGFEGRIYPVNPRASEIQGLPAYPAIGDVPEAADLAIIALPGAAAPAALDACIEHGVRAAIMFSSGYAESDPHDGLARQEALARRARAGGLRLLGPNCFGMVNFTRRLAATFGPSFGLPIVPGGRVAMVSQSGAFCSHAYVMARRRGLALSAVLTTGNEADVDVADGIAYLARQEETRVILLYLEGARDGARLRAALDAAAAAGKPVVAIKVGRTDAGAAAAASHTAALAGSDRIYDALFAQHGVHRAGNIEEFLDIGYAASVSPSPRGRRIGLTTVSGGIGILMADAAVDEGLEVNPLPEVARARIKEMVPFAGVANVVDVTGQVLNDRDLHERAIEIVIEDGACASLASFQGSLGTLPLYQESSLAMWRRIRAAHPQTAIAVVGVSDQPYIDDLADAGIMNFEDPARAVRALAVLARVAEAAHQRTHAGPDQATAPDFPLPAGRTLTELESLRLLEAHGLPVVPARVVDSPAAAAAAVAALDGPAAIKVASPDIVHKSDVGGVRLGVSGEDAAAAAYGSIIEACRAAAPDASIEGCLVAPMVEGGIEVILGVHRDPVLGPVVMFGLGGVLVEALGDVAFRLAPVSEAQARQMITEIRAARILEGVRGAPPSDVEALVAAIVALGRLAAHHRDAIETVDVNPFVLRPRGEGAVALDAVCVTSSPEAIR